jgi:hypothetical protein
MHPILADPCRPPWATHRLHGKIFFSKHSTYAALSYPRQELQSPILPSDLCLVRAILEHTVLKLSKWHLVQRSRGEGIFVSAKHKYGYSYPYSNSNVVVRWIHRIRFCRFFHYSISCLFDNIRQYPYSKI